jgi:hypothetical protein
MGCSLDLPVGLIRKVDTNGVGEDWCALTLIVLHRLVGADAGTVGAVTEGDYEIFIEGGEGCRIRAGDSMVGSDFVVGEGGKSESNGDEQAEHDGEDGVEDHFCC